jgi:hypothetical protein
VHTLKLKTAHLLISSPQGERMKVRGNFKYLWLEFGEKYRLEAKYSKQKI